MEDKYIKDEFALMSESEISQRFLSQFSAEDIGKALKNLELVKSGKFEGQVTDHEEQVMMAINDFQFAIARKRISSDENCMIQDCNQVMVAGNYINGLWSRYCQNHLSMEKSVQ